jgi:rod shape-determining protein MreD
MSESVRPSFILMGIYFWSIYRPTLIPPLLLFVVGLIYDVLMGFPLALHSVLFIAAHWGIKNQRLFFLGQSYWVLWIGFSIICFSMLILEYLFFSILAQSFLNVGPLIGNVFLSSFLFPLLSFIFNKTNDLLPVSSNSISQVD